MIVQNFNIPFNDIFFSHFLAVIFRTVIEKGRDFNKVIKVWIGPKLLVFLVDPRDIELVLGSQIYIDKAPEYRFFKPWLGNGLLISTGEFRFCFVLKIK